MGNLCTACERPHPSSMNTMAQQPITEIEERIHNCLVRISYGDLLQENTDAIVAVVNPALSFQGKLCKYIL
jgi:biotin synthase-related radical SAM superfamily protein